MSRGISHELLGYAAEWKIWQGNIYVRDFAFFLGGKSSSSLATLDDILWSRRTSRKNSLFN